MTHVCVGNDVVDLENPRTEGKSDDERFVRRVFDDVERDGIRGAEDPDLDLWARWAAKEAGFKTISKLIGSPPPFLHRAFKVSWTTDAADEDAAADEATERDDARGRPIRRGVVRYHEHEARVRVARHDGSLHAVSFAVRAGEADDVRVEPHVARLDAPERVWSRPLEELMSLFTEREADAVYSRRSAAVRVGARSDLAFLLGVPEDRIEIVCSPGPTSQRPPSVLLDGRPTQADVSLSHDGDWIAWALWVGPEPRRIS